MDIFNKVFFPVITRTFGPAIRRFAPDGTNKREALVGAAEGGRRFAPGGDS
jgi:hypothetical protein